MKNKKYFSLLFLLGVFFQKQGISQQLSFSLYEKGLKSLKYDGHEFIKKLSYGEFARYNVYGNFTHKDGSTYSVGPDNQGSTSWDKNNNKIIITYNWGSVSCQYAVQASNRLNITLIIKNATQESLNYVSSNLIILTFPTIPQASLAGKWPIPLYKQPIWVDQHEWPGVLQIDYGTHIMALCNDESPERNFRIGVKNSYATKQEYLFGMDIFEPIPTGKTATFHLSLRFGAPSSRKGKLAGDVYKKFIGDFPFQVTWKDRRVIGDAFLSARAVKQAFVKNPRGWFNNDSKVDVTTEEGKEDFRKKLLKYADDCITILKQLDAQGIIVWDIEGQEFPGIIYVGDPTMLPELAPEMEWKGSHAQSTVDAFFNKFTESGLRCGICIRPSKVSKNGQGYVQQYTDQPEKTLIDKINYAKKRWGCTLFYIDSNKNKDVSRYVILDALIFKRIQEAHPDVLLIPEAENAKYYAYTAPYDELRRGVNATPSPVKAIYPKAFSVINISDGDISANQSALIEAVKNGDILMCHAWYNSKSTVATQSIISEVQRTSSSEKKRPKR